MSSTIMRAVFATVKILRAFSGDAFQSGGQLRLPKRLNRCGTTCRRSKKSAG